LKKYSGNRKETPPVDIDTFFEYFKNLNFCEEEDSDINIDEFCNDPMYNEMLNGIIPEYFFKVFQNPFVSFFDSAISSDAHFSLYF
jgi:hypothetical protein